MEQLLSIINTLTEGNRPILLGLWVCGHCLIVLTFIAKAKNIVFVSMAVLLLTLYCLKPPTYDLQKYSVFFDTGYLHSSGSRIGVTDDGILLQREDTTGERYLFGTPSYSNTGFSQLIKLMSQTLPAGNYLPRLSLPEYEGWFVADSLVLGIMVLTFIVLQFSINNLLRDTTSFYSFSGPVLLISAPIIIGSIFFLLGSQNSIRQFLAITIFILALTCYVRQRYLLVLIFLFVANSFHQWAWVFGLGMALFLFGEKMVSKLNTGTKRLDFLRIEHCSLIGGVAVALMISLLIRLSITSGYLGELLVFGSRIDFSGHIERVSVLYKIALIGLLLLISELLAGRTPDSVRIPIRSLRRSMFLFLVPICLYSEILSRLLVFYFCVEMVCVVSMVFSESLRSRAAGMFIFASYSVAPNAINIIIGPQWRFSLG